jgi:hypothetical protein
MTAPSSKLAVPLMPLLPHMELDASGQKLLDGAEDAATGVERLQGAGRMIEAARIVAYALPKREAVWWACMCARATPDTKATPDDQAALDAAESWVRLPDEKSRRAAMAAAEKAKFGSAEAWAAIGAFWSGGSLAPEGQPEVPPAEHLTGSAIAGAVLLAAVRIRPEKQLERLARYLESARSIATGGAGRMDRETI